MNTLIQMAVLGVAVAAFAGGAQAASPGASVYQRTCVACHGKDGRGAIPGVPALGGKGGPLEKSDAVLMKNMIEGYQRSGSPLAMPPKGGDPSLTGDDIAAVLQYMREAFGP